MIWMVGMLFTKIENLIERFKMQYVLYCLSEHGTNCHLDGKSTITAPTIHMGNNVLLGGGYTHFYRCAYLYW